MTTTPTAAPQEEQAPQKKQVKTAHIIRFPANAGPLTPTQRSSLDTLIDFMNRANISLSRNGDKALVLEAQTERARVQSERVISYAIDRIFGDEKEHKLTRSHLRAEWTTQQRLTSPVSKREVTAAEKQAKPQTHSLEYVTELPNDTSVELIVDLLTRKPKAVLQLNPFKNMLQAEVARENDKLRILFPVFENDALTQKYRTDILESLAQVSSDITNGRAQRLEESMISRAIRQVRDGHVQAAQKPSAKAAAKAAFAPEQVSPLAYVRVNGQDMTSFAEYMMNGRNAAFRALAENDQVPFNIQAMEDGGRPVFVVSFPDAQAPLDRALQTQAEYFLALLYNKFDKNQKINKEVVEATIPELYKALKPHTDLVPGDKLSPVFVNLAQERGAHLIEAPVKKAEKSAGAPKVYDIAQHSGQSLYTPEVNFTLPQFNSEGVMTLKRRGVEDYLALTDNQKLLIKAILDPSIQIIFCQGPAGSGKTLWGAYAAFELIKRGYLAKFYYERPLTGVDGEEIGFLPGDADEKMQPFNNVFESKCAEILGHGDIGKGGETLSEMKEKDIYENYQGMFNRGDTVYGSILMLDEAQNKSEGQLFHYMTRLDNRSKLLMMGDGEFQTDRKDSGFLKTLNMYKDVPGIAVIVLGAEDIKRSELVANIYRARKQFEAAANGNNQHAAPQVYKAPETSYTPSGM